jgi:putative SOS response-associated peptidase YedK
MLTFNAELHPLMNQFHKPTDEKRMIVILPPERYDDWLKASAGESAVYLKPWPSEAMRVLEMR